jgi:hypothetical protein
MTLNSMAVHDTEGPHSFQASEVLMHEITILINFAHLRDVPSSGLESKLFNTFLFITFTTDDWTTS